MSVSPAILERIRKLLAVSSDRGNALGEVEAAAAAVRKLLDAHGLTLADLQRLGDSAGVETIDVEHGYQRPPKWLLMLVSNVAKGFDCIGLHCRHLIWFAGLAEDVAVASWLLAALLRELPRAARQAADHGGLGRAAEISAVWIGGRCHRLPLRGDTRRKFVESFLFGAADRIGRRLQAERATTPEQGALVVRKKELITSALGGVKTKAVECRAQNDLGLVLGDEYGRQAALSPDVLPTAAPAQSPPKLGFSASV